MSKKQNLEEATSQSLKENAKISELKEEQEEDDECIQKTKSNTKSAAEKKKRTLNENQMAAIRVNLAKGREKLKEKWEMTREERKKEADELVLKKAAKIEKTRENATKKIQKVILGNEPIPESDDDEEEVVVHKRSSIKRNTVKPKKKIVYYESSESEGEEVEIIRKKSVKNKNVEEIKPTQQSPLMQIKFC